MDHFKAVAMPPSIQSPCIILEIMLVHFRDFRPNSLQPLVHQKIPSAFVDIGDVTIRVASTAEFSEHI